MMQFTKFIILCFTLRCNYAARLPVSPCPNVFAYEGEPESDRWYGVITFSSNIELVGLNYKVQLDRPSNLLVSWDGEVRSDDNINYSVFDPFHTQRAGEIVKARIMVKYNHNQNNVPGIAKIIINGNTLCSVESGSGSGMGIGLSGTTTGRPDPSFNSEEGNSEYSNNRGQSNNQNTYNTGGFNTGNDNRPNPPSYGNQNEPHYVSSYPNVPNYNSNTGSGSQNVPVYTGGGSSGNLNFGNNPSSNSNYPSSGPNAPSYNSGGSGSSNSNPPNYVNPTYTGSQASYGSSDSVNYPNGQGTGTNYGNSQAQWPETQQVSPNNNRNTAQNGYANPQTNTVDSSPIVTTLALPNGLSNKTNIDQLVQNIKNQLEQQQLNSNSNKTVIVAVVYPTNNLVSSSSTEIHHTTDPPTSHRTTQSTPTASTIRVKNVVPTVKQNNQRNKD
jgi:hypothetical protein